MQVLYRKLQLYRRELGSRDTSGPNRHPLVVQPGSFITRRSISEWVTIREAGSVAELVCNLWTAFMDVDTGTGKNDFTPRLRRGGPHRTLPLCRPVQPDSPKDETVGFHGGVTERAQALGKILYGNE